MAEITAIGTGLLLVAGGIGIAGLALEIMKRMMVRALRSPEDIAYQAAPEDFYSSQLQ